MKFSIIFTGYLILSIIPVFSQNPDSALTSIVSLREDSGLFESDDPLEITLRFDISGFKKQKDDTTYIDGFLSTFPGDDTVTKKIRVRPRGEFRRKFCDMPPMLLNFDRDDTIAGDFQGINKLKMVTVCFPAKQEYLLREYLVYKLYSVVTDISYRVRLLKVNYIDSNKRDRVSTEFGFVIEPDEMLAKRIQAIEVKTTNLTQKNVKPDMMDRMAIFNYMIGNADWSVPIGHNIKLFAQYSSDRPDLATIVPFDFDFSGIVNAYYAAPFPGLDISSVRERIYLGMCRDREIFVKALSEFRSLKSGFYSIIKDFKLIDEPSKDEMISYLDSFFEDLEKPETLARAFSRECIKF